MLQLKSEKTRLDALKSDLESQLEAAKVSSEDSIFALEEQL